MKIAFNPSTVAALTTPPNNKDITFDLRGRNIFARGVKFYGTDTNTWRDIKINNVSIGSHTLDLRNGSNTTLTNTNGVVTINSTWRPVVDNLTSDSTTSSLSAKQGKVLKALIDGKSNSDHNHDGRYVRYYAVTTLDCNNLAAGLTAARISATNAAHTNHSAYLYISDVGTPFQIQIPDSSISYIYKRCYGSGKWSGWFKLSAGYADSAGSVAWANVTGKPSSYTPSAHTHAWNSLTHSSTTENQAILTNGKANGWKLQTLNIARWDNAANNAHSHANKSVLDGITSALVNSWNTAYNFVSNITGTDTDKVINKWEEIVNFLAGITEDNKLNTLLNSKLSVYELADKTNVGTIKNNGIYYSTTDASSSTLTNSPFNNGFTLINMTSYNDGDDLRRSRLAFNAYGEIKVSDDRDQANTAETWYNVLTSKNSGINGSTIKLNGTSITVYSSGTADGRYVKKSGDTMQGVLTIDTTNFGALTIKRNDDANGASIQFRGKSSVYGYIGLNNSTKDKQFLRWSSDTSKIYTILDTSSTYISNGKGVINGTTITQVDNATNSTNSTNARKLVNWYSARPTSLNAQFGDGSLRIFYATSSTTEGKPAEDSHILHLAWDNTGGYDAQLAVHARSGKVSTRAQNAGTWQPWKTLAFTTDIPTSLKNPYSFNVFGVVYDGSAAKTVTTSNFISQVNEGTSTITDGTMLITSWASNSGFADTNAVNVPYKRKAIHLWEYIKAKTDSLYATKGHNHDGRYLRLSGQDTMQGNLYLHSHGTSYIGKGLGDKSGADFTEANIVIRSWWGISFKSYDDIVRTYIDTRTGNIGTKGVLNAVGAVIQGRVYNGGDDEGIIINPAPNGYAGLILGTHNGERSVFYLKKGNPFWRYNNGSTNLDIYHPKKSGTIALTSDIPNKDSWNYDDRYLKLTGGWMQGDINFGGDNKIHWGRNTDSASISFKNDGDGDANSYMSFATSDNGNEYFRWSHNSGSTNTEWMALRSDGLRVRGTKVSLEGHSHNDLYYTKAESNAKYITDITTSVNKLTFTKNGSNIARNITVNVVYSQGNLTNISNKDNTTKASSGLYIYNSYNQVIGTNSYSSVLSINTGGTIQIAGNWGDDQTRNLYWRSQSDKNVADYPWKSWRTILDSENYSSTLDSRYYTESEVNSLLNAKLDRQNLSYGNWNPRGWNLAADYHYNGGDLSISENNGKMYVSVDGCFWQNEGQYKVLDTSDIGDIRGSVTLHQYLSATDAAWYPLVWGGASHTNTSDSTGPICKSYDKLSWQTSSQTLYATNIQTNNIKNLSIGGGIYWNPNVESASDGSDAASITLVRSGVAGGTTLVLSQMNDTNDTIQFKTNTAARLYHNSYPILTTQNTYVSNNKGYINGLEITQVNNADTLDGYHAASFVKMYTGKFNQYNEGTWTKILQFTIPSGHLQPTISFIWHPTECARDVWADFNINIRSGSPIFYVNWKGTTRRTVYCVGDGTTYSVWVQGTKSQYDPFGLVQVISTWQINTYQAGSLQYSDSEPTGTYKVVASMSGIIMYADRLLTARKINGTSFDGTSDITTAYWGTTRTISLTGAITGSVSTNGGGNITINTTYGTGNITNLDNRYVKKAGDTMQGNLTFTSGKQTRWTAHGTSYITDGNVDSGTSLGGNLANLVISSWYGVSFTTSCSGQTYTNKTAVGINCRTGIVYAANFVGPLQGNAATATKLQTSRSIWGQSFDGTRDVSGTLSGVANIQFSADGAYDIGSNSATSRYIYTHWLGAKSGSKLELGANNSGFGQGLCIDTNLNVGIGTNSPTQKLDVIGNIRATGQLYLPTNGNYNAILMGDDCWMGDCNISNVIGLSGTNNANSGGIKFGKGGMYIGYNGSSHYSSGTSLWTNFNADTVDGEHASNFSYTHQSSFDFSKRKSGRIVTFDQSNTDYGWINGFASTHNDYLTSVIFNKHRSSDWYVGYMEGNQSTGETNGLQAVHKLAFADGDESYPIFLGYLHLYNGNDGTISGSFPCLGYSVPFTYTRGGAYCLINIPNTTHQVFYIKAAIASVHYSGAGMGHWVGNHRGDGAWWLHCDAVGSNAVQVKGFHLANKNNDSWWGGNPLYSGDGAAKIITVCLFGYVKFR